MKLLPELSTALIGAAAIVLVQPYLAVAQTAEEVSSKAEKFTVSILQNEQLTGSGVIVNYVQQSNIYYILTAAHVVGNRGEYKVVTPNGTKHTIDDSKIIRLPNNVDLAILQFTSSESYTIAKFGDSKAATRGNKIYVSGFPKLEEGKAEINVIPGAITGFNPKNYGQDFIYVNSTKSGLSGGAVLDAKGSLIGIHYRGAGTTKDGFNYGIPIHIFLELAPSAFAEAGKAKLKAQKYQEAIADFNQGLQFNPNSPDAYLGLAYAWFAQKKYEKVVENAEKAIEKNSQLADAYLLLGAIYALQKEDKKAIETFDQAIKNQPNFSLAYALRGVSKAKTKDSQGAFADANKAIELAPTSYISYRSVSLIRSALGDIPGAQEARQKADQLQRATGDMDSYQIVLNQGLETLLTANPIAVTPLPNSPKPDSKPTPVIPKPSPTIQRVPVTLTRNIPQKEEISAIALSPDGKTLAIGLESGKIELWNVQTGQLRPKSPIGHRVIGILSLAFSPDGTTLVSTARDQTVRLWKVQTSEKINDIQGWVNSVAFTPDGKTLVTGMEDGTIKLWLLSNFTQYRKNIPTGTVFSIAISRDGKMLASGGQGGIIKLWSLPDGKLLRTLTGHKESVYSVAFSPVDQTLVSGSADKTIKIWNTSTGNLQSTVPVGEVLQVVAISRDGNTFASGSDSKVQLWNLSNGNLLGTVSTHSRPVSSVIFSADGKTLIVGSKDQGVNIWQLTSP